jgi:DNA repair exonuclease SbcCD ATPase subunit
MYVRVMQHRQEKYMDALETALAILAAQKKAKRERHADYQAAYREKRKNDPELKEKQKQATANWRNNNLEKISKDSLEYRRNNKRKAVEYLGGKCSACSGEFHPAVYDFHHTDPNVKESSVSRLLNSGWEIIKAEIDKCELLCANCHRIQHAKEHDYE